MSESVNQQDANQTDSGLRNRLAEVIGNTSWIATDLEVADAVIRELDLTKEFGCNTDARHGCRCSHRYTTNWRHNNID